MKRKSKQKPNARGAANRKSVRVDDAKMRDRADVEPPFEEEEYDESCDTDPDSTTRCRTWEDLDRFSSYFTSPDSGGGPEVRTYRFGEYGNLRIALIDGKAWCPLEDAGFITGLRHDDITGDLGDADQPVRGKPGYLEPNELRFIHGEIQGMCIRIAALIPVFMKARGGKALTDYLLTQVLPHVYAASPTACAPFPPAADHDPRGKLRRWRCYRKDLGEVCVVFLGTRAWLNLSDITRITRFNSGLITEVVGKSQAITIPCSDLSNSDGNSGSEVYILAEAFFRLLKASDYPLERSKALESWIEGLQCPRRQLASGRFVYASTLHRMLRQHMPFQYWIRNLTRIQPGPVELMLENDPAHQYEPEGNDHRVPLTKALEIAKLVGGDAGRLVSILIQDGGFQHGGHAAESMNATLLRFQGLMPDHLGRVNARCVHEFTNKREPFEVWVEQQAKLNGYYYPPLRYELITLDEAESRGIWDTNKRACYYGMS